VNQDCKKPSWWREGGTKKQSSFEWGALYERREDHDYCNFSFAAQEILNG
jgi:hypothetical protein